MTLLPPKGPVPEDRGHYHAALDIRESPRPTYFVCVHVCSQCGKPIAPRPHPACCSCPK